MRRSEHTSPHRKQLLFQGERVARATSCGVRDPKVAGRSQRMYVRGAQHAPRRRHARLQHAHRVAGAPGVGAQSPTVSDLPKNR